MRVRRLRAVAIEDFRDVHRPAWSTIKTLAMLPIAPGVTVHSIIGVKEGGTLAEASDGVVGYRSVDLDEAVSELIVRSGHAVQGHPEAIEEIRRVLLEHLGSAGSATAQ